MMLTNPRLIGMGQPPPPPPPPPPGPPPPPPFPMIWPPYQPTVYIERQHDYQIESPCKWYEDLHGVGDSLYCRAPAVWLVIAAVGVSTLFMMMGRR